MAIAQAEKRRPKRTFTMDDEVFELLTEMANGADVSRSRMIEKLVRLDHEAYDRLTQAAAGVQVEPVQFFDRAVFLDDDPYERLAAMAQKARADRRQFLEHLILRAEAVWNFQPPPAPLPRPWWKLWGKNSEPEVPAIVADLRDVA